MKETIEKSCSTIGGVPTLPNVGSDSGVTSVNCRRELEFHDR